MEPDEIIFCQDEGHCVCGNDCLTTDSERLDYLYQVAKRADKLMNELEPQIKPFLDGLAKNPMLKMLGLGK